MSKRVGQRARARDALFSGFCVVFVIAFAIDRDPCVAALAMLYAFGFDFVRRVK